MHTGSSHVSLIFRERLSIPAIWWFVAAAISAMTSLMVLPVWKLGGVLVPVLVFIAVAMTLRTLIPTVAVTATEFFAGDAHIERRYISAAQALTGEDAFIARGQQLDARAFLMTRPWVKDVVKVTINDPADPTPYWLVSTRQAEQLAEVLGKPAQSPTEKLTDEATPNKDV